MEGIQYNFEAGDVDAIFEALHNCETLPSEIKRKLYFLQSDQYVFVFDDDIQRVIY